VESDDSNYNKNCDYSKKLQGFDSVAEGNGFGSADIPGNENVPERRNVSADRSTATGSSVGAILFNGRSDSTIDGGVSSLSVDNSGAYWQKWKHN